MPWRDRRAAGAVEDRDAVGRPASRRDQAGRVVQDRLFERVGRLDGLERHAAWPAGAPAGSGAIVTLLNAMVSFVPSSCAQTPRPRK